MLGAAAGSEDDLGEWAAGKHRLAMRRICLDVAPPLPTRRYDRDRHSLNRHAALATAICAPRAASG